LLAPTSAFVAGYGLAWAGFSVLATLAQWALERAALLSPMWVATSAALGAGLMIVAGAYQLSSWKNGCLRHCQSPGQFLAAHWGPGVRGALALGWRHGLYCIGCCAPLMGLLFVGGVMNLLWIAAIAVFVLLEKLLPSRWGVRPLCGIALIVLGALWLARGVR
jgi:predicted metal-binding membrane protein